MKTLHFIAFLLFINLKITAQTVAIAVEKMNVFYIGIDNPVSIAVEGVADEKLKVTISNGFIEKREKGRYSVRVMQFGEAEITVEWEGKKAVQKFRVKAIANPKLEFKGCNECKPEGIAFKYGNTDLDIDCKIQSYVVIFSPKYGEIKEFHVTGSDFNAELNKTMQNAKQGDVFDFMQVKVRCSFEHNYPISSLKYVVKN